MSYEGYVQRLCKRGHHRTHDVWGGFDDNHAPCSCGAPFVWENEVDVTNGSWDKAGNRIDGYVEPEVKEEAVYEECKCCGNKKLISEKTFKVPNDVGHKLSP